MRDGLTEDELNQAKNKVLARSVLRSERPMGRLASLGFHWMYRRRYISGRRGARGLQPRHARRPAPAARRLAALAADDRLGRPDDRDPPARLTCRVASCIVPLPIATDFTRASLTMRIVSLLPSLTELVCTLGKRDDLVGVTHECDYPAGVERLPHLTRSRIPARRHERRDRRTGRGAGRKPVRARRKPARGVAPRPDPHAGTVRRMRGQRGDGSPSRPMPEEPRDGRERQSDDSG